MRSKSSVLFLVFVLCVLSQFAVANTLVFNSPTVVGGNGTTATLTVAGNSTGTNRTFLFSSNSVSVTVPSSVILLAGTLVVNFSTTTSTVSTPVQATITETAPNGTHVYGYLPVLANPLSSVSITANPVSGGTSTTGTITLGDNAPTGGAVVNLSSSNTSAATVPAAVNVLAGNSSATFSVSTSSVTSNALSTITAAVGGSTVTTSLTVEPILASLTLPSSSVMGGTTAVGTLQLSRAAGSGGFAISLSSSSRFAVVPPTITVPSGSLSASFPIWTSPCAAIQSSVISASSGGGSATANLSLNTYSPFVFGVQVPNTYLVGGSPVTSGVQLDHYVTAVDGEDVSLSTSNVDGSTPAAASVPSTVTIPFGSNSATFTVTTSSVPGVTGVFIIAQDGVQAQEGLVMLMSSGGLGLSLSSSPTGIFGGSSATGTVTLSASQASDTVVSLASTDTSVTVPASVTVPSGSTTATFNISTSAIGSQTGVLDGGWIWVTASAGLSSQTMALSIYPSQLHSISATPSSVAGGTSSTGTVTVAGRAPTGGITVSLSSDSSGVTIPASVTIPAGSSAGTFAISTASTSNPYTANLSSSYGGVTKSCAFGVGASVLVHSISSTPGSVAGGASAIGSVTLNGNAPDGGTTISLSSSSGLVSLPATVTIPPGQSSTTFSISTVGTLTAASATLSASLNGRSVTCGFGVGISTLLKGISASPGSVIGGNSSIGTVTLTAPAPASGAVVSLASTSGSVVLPGTVTILSGSTTATFGISTIAVGSGTTSTLSANLGTVTKTCAFIVSPPTLAGLTTAIATVQGGTAVSVTVTLTGVAPAGGTVVPISSSSVNAAVPSSVIIPEGQTGTTFSVATSAVTSNASVIITAVNVTTIHLTIKLTP